MIDRLFPDRTMDLRAQAILASARTRTQEQAADAWREHFRWTQRRVGGDPPARVRDDYDYMAAPDPLRRLPS